MTMPIRHAALIAALLAGGAGGLALASWGPTPSTPAEARRTLPWLLKANADMLMGEERYAEAWAALDSAVQLVPDDVDLRRALAACARERDNEKVLGEAREALDREQLPEAAGALRRFGFPSAQEYRLNVLKAQLERKCNTAMDELEPRLATAQTEPELSAAMSRGAEVRIACSGPRVVEIDAMMRDAPSEPASCWQARRAFRAGSLAEAARLAHRCADVDRESAPVATSIDVFIERRRGEDQMTSTELAGLIAQADRIGWLAHSVPAEEIRHRGVARFLKKAEQCKAKKDWRGVAMYVGFVRTLDPDNAQASELGREASRAAVSKVRGTYNSNERDPGEASRLFDRIMDMGTEEELAHQRSGRHP
jgi:hypothetical protein